MGQKVVIFIATIILALTGLLLGYVLSQLVLGYATLNLLTFLGTLSLILIFGTVYYVLFWELRRQQAQQQQRRPILQTEQPKLDNNLKNRLVTMLDGDTTEAERLISQAKQERPGMPENWYWEKTIAQLERDRQ